MPTAAIVIAIDGPSGSGKSTVARQVAERLGYLYVDSGAMYRAVALVAREEGIPPGAVGPLAACAARLHIDLQNSPTGLRVLANGRDVTEAIRAPQVSQLASVVATLPAVRERLVAEQRRIGARGGIVMEGRDIGTVVFPDSALKIFLTASPEERARRRCQQQVEQGIPSSLEKTLEEIRQRDHRDATRKVSPLVEASDAVHLDSTALTAEEAVEVICRLAGKRQASPKADSSPRTIRGSE
ncbi:MAG: (d)CMP kinase [Candidatus Acidoferrales bacterium]